MGVVSDQAVSSGDLMRRMAELERRLDTLGTARRLEAASIGTGGLRIQGGLLRVQDTAGDDMFRAGGDPGELFLRQDLLTPFAVAVLGDRLFSAAVGNVEQSSSGTYTDLATAGPTVSGVNVITGKMLVIVSSSILLNLVNSAGMSNSPEGFVSFQVSGATSVTPSDTNAANRRMNLATHNGANPHVINESGTYSKTVLVEGLNPGTHAVQAKYKHVGGGTADVRFGIRNLTVIAF